MSTVTGDTKETEKTLAQKLQEEQLENTDLENQKAQIELENLRINRGWGESLARLIPLLSTIIALVGFMFSVMQYNRQQKNDLALRQENSDNALMEPWVKSQKEIYTEALTHAASVANPSNAADRSVAVTKFWQIFHGKMIFVETKSVANAMNAFGNCIDTCNSRDLNAKCDQLATAMRESMAATAKMKYSDFADNQFKYEP